MSDAEEVKFSLKVMINKEKTKVLFAEADNHFTDILLSFLTLLLGRIVKVLEKHYGDEAPSIGSLNTLYHSLSNLDSDHFWTKDAKLTLLDPTSSFEAEYERLKLDFTDPHPAEYFSCSYTSGGGTFRSVSMYYDKRHCNLCRYNHLMSKKIATDRSQAATSVGVFSTHTSSFIISDDLQILPNATGLFGITTILGITGSDRDKAELINVAFGYNEIMNLLKASLISQTPLSDLILNNTRQITSVTVESEPKISSIKNIEFKENPKSKKMILKAVIQKSTSKLLYAQAEEDFIEFLFSLLCIPVGRVERLGHGSKTCMKAIHNLCRSTTDLIDDKYFKTSDVKDKLIQLNLPHGCVSENHIFALIQACLPAEYSDTELFYSEKFPSGQGCYLQGPRTYQVTDDLTVTPFCVVSILAGFNELKIPASDVKEVELQIGLEEGLRILKASLTSTSALSDALLNNHTSNKKPEPEIYV